jgi:Holliday junction resolvasome RuvABC endonuclease subunit
VPEIILALDPANRCGFAFSGYSHHGVWHLTVAPDEPRGNCLVRLYTFIRDFHKEHPFTVLAFEDAAMGASSNRAVQSIHSMKAGILEYAATRLGFRTVSYYPHQIKKFATGNGGTGKYGASKEQMIAAAQTKLGYQGNDPDEADALWVLALAEHWQGQPIPRQPKRRKSKKGAKGKSKTVPASRTRERKLF